MGIYYSKASPRVTPVSTVNRADLVQDDAEIYNLPLFRFRKNTGAVLAAAGDGTYLGCAWGTHGTDGPYLVGTACNNASQTETARILFELPPEYQDGQTVTIRVHAHVDTTPLTVSATVDIQCYETDGEKAVGADLCATAAQDCNASAWADFDFTITPTGLAAGDILDIEITAAGDDSGGAVNKSIEIGAVQVLLDIKG
jgi:hypothetical protein